MIEYPKYDQASDCTWHIIRHYKESFKIAALEINSCLLIPLKMR